MKISTRLLTAFNPFNSIIRYLTAPEKSIRKMPLSDTFKKGAVLENIIKSKKRGQRITTQRPFNRQTTKMWRNDTIWLEQGNYLKNRFANDEKVRVYIGAGSGGHETYTLSILLQETCGEEAKKFFPLYTFDIAKEEINAANAAKMSGNVIIPSLSNKYNFENKFLKENPDFPFRDGCNALGITKEQMEKYMIELNDGSVKLTPATTAPAKFEYANVLDLVYKLDENNPTKLVFICRNMWPYVEEKYYKEFAEQLFKRAPKGSCVILGSYDITGGNCGFTGFGIDKYLRDAGFYPDYNSKIPREKFGTTVFEKN